MRWSILKNALASNEWKIFADEVLKPTYEANNSLLGGYDPKEHNDGLQKTLIAVINLNLLC